MKKIPWGAILVIALIVGVYQECNKKDDTLCLLKGCNNKGTGWMHGSGSAVGIDCYGCCRLSEMYGY